MNAVKQLSPKEKLILDDDLWEENIEIPTEHQTLVLGKIEIKEPYSIAVTVKIDHTGQRLCAIR